MVKDKDMRFFMENLKMKSNKDKQIFSNFPANDLFFHGKWGMWDQIKISF